jgi:hypothetical protein
MSTTRPYGRTAMTAARTVVVLTEGGRIFQDAVDRARHRTPHPLAIALYVAEKLYRPQARAEPACQVRESRLVPARCDDAARAHRHGDRDGCAAEVACGAADKDRFARLQARREETTVWYE